MSYKEKYTNAIRELLSLGIQPIFLAVGSKPYTSIKSVLPTNSKVILLNGESELKEIVDLLDDIKQGMFHLYVTLPSFTHRLTYLL